MSRKCIVGRTGLLICELSLPFGLIVGGYA